MTPIRHLLRIPAAAGIGFLAAYPLGDLLTLPVDLYYLAYFVIVYLFLATTSTCPRTAGRARAPARPARDPRRIGG